MPDADVAISYWPKGTNEADAQTCNESLDFIVLMVTYGNLHQNCVGDSIVLH